MKEKYMFFVNSQERNLFDFELNLVFSLTKIWNYSELISIIVLNEIVDNYYVTKNKKYIHEKSFFIGAKDQYDLDGALIDITIFQSADGDFSEINIVRLDTKALIFPKFAMEPNKLDYLSQEILLGR